MAKDRLPDLIKNSGLNRSQSYQRSQSITESTAIDIPPTDEKTTIDEILNEYTEIRILLATINSNLDLMMKMVQIQTTNIRHFNENEMDELRCENMQIGNKLMLRFKTLKIQLPNDNEFTLEARMKRTLFYGLHQTFINLWNKNEQFLLSYETKLKKHLHLHTKILNYNSTDEQVELLISNKQTSLFVDNILEDTERERRTLRDLMDRYSELKKLEKSIEDVHILFMRIQNLVIEQNDLIQVIECHAQQATIRIDKGADDLDRALILKEKTLKKKTCLITVLIVILIIFILLLFI